MQRGTCWIARPDPWISGLTPEQKAWVYERTAKALLGEK